MLLHGFPELWYSWRHQIPAVAAAGYHAVAPDLRGYGGTDAPEAIEAYSMRRMMDDVIGILDDLGAARAALVGHDWGANIAWAVAEHYPARVAAVVALGVPYHERPPVPPTRLLERLAGERFNFALHFQAPGVAEAEMERDVRDSLRRFFFALSGDAPAGLLDRLYTARPADSGTLDGMPDPRDLPPWLREEDLAVYVRTFRRTGFRGALNRYRNLDRDWHELPGLGAAGVHCPALFVAGTRDPAVVYGSLTPMLAAVPGLTRAVLLPGAGHWTQQERPGAVTAELIHFLQRQIGHPTRQETHAGSE